MLNVASRSCTPPAGAASPDGAGAALVDGAGAGASVGLRPSYHLNVADTAVLIPRARGRTLTRGLLVAVTVAVVVLRMPSFFRQLYDPDEAAIAVQGMGLVRGGVLYTDVIDRKPPLAPWLYAESFRLFGNQDLRPLHVLAALELIAAALVIAWELRRRVGQSAAWWGAMLFVFGALAFAPPDAQAANFSHLALLPGVGAIVLARRPGARNAVIAGVLVGVATLTRQSWAIGVIPAAFAAWYHGNRQWTRAVQVVVGALVCIASVGLVVPFGAFVHWTFTGNGSLLFGLSQATHIIASGSGSFWLFVAGHLALCALLIARGWHREDTDLWLWVVAGLLMWMAGFRFFGHYWLQVLPPLCLLAAPAIERCNRLARQALGATMGVTAFAFFVLAWFPGTIHRLPNAKPVAQLVKSQTKFHDRVAVWGSYPEVYWLSNRLPAAGLIHTDFVVGKSAGRLEGPATLRDATPGAIHHYLAALESSPPKLFLDTSTARLRGYGEYPVTVLPGLLTLLRTDYHKVGMIDGITVYERVPVPAPTSNP
jgi:hypothetical protein